MLLRLATPLVLLVALALTAVPGNTLAEEVEEDARVEVIEFFWYGCPHCYRFQSDLHDWLEDKPDYVDFEMVPALVSGDWEVHARAFYAAQLLDALDQFHFAFYEALHAEGQQLDSIDSIAAFADSLDGVDGEEFAATMESFGVESRLREARNVNQEYGLRGTPSMGVNGELFSPGDFGSFSAMMEAVDDHAASEWERQAALGDGGDD